MAAAAAGLLARRQSTVTTMPRVTCSSGEKVVSVVPFIMPASETSPTAWAYQASEATSEKGAAEAGRAVPTARPRASSHAQSVRFMMVSPAFLCPAGSAGGQGI